MKNKQKIVDCKDCIFLTECAIKTQELGKTQKEICPAERVTVSFRRILDEKDAQIFGLGNALEDYKKEAGGKTK